MVSIFGTESRTSSSAGTSGAQAATGDPTSITVTGGDDVSSDIAVTNFVETTNNITDGGAVRDALDFAREASRENTNVLDSILNFADGLTFDVIDVLRAVNEGAKESNALLASGATDLGRSAEVITIESLRAQNETNRRSLDTVDDAVDGSLDFARDSQAEVLRFSRDDRRDSLDLVRDVVRDSGNLIDDARRDSLQFVGDSLRLVDDARRDSIDQVGDAYRDSFGLVDDARRESNRLIDDARQDSLNFATDLVDRNADLAGDAFNAVDDARRDSFQFVGESLELIDDARNDSLQFADNLFTDALGIISDSQVAGFTASQQALTEINRDATERTSTKVLYVAGAIAVAAIVGAAIVGSNN